MSTDYPEIAVKDIREGDKIRVDLRYLTISKLDYAEYTAECDRDAHYDTNFDTRTYYLIERPVELTTGMIIQGVPDSRDYWIRTGKNTWAAAYLGLRQFHPQSTLNDDMVRIWLRAGSAKVVDTSP